MSVIASAWMIRNDGRAIPCIQHIYADINEVEESLAAAQWLYSNTRHPETKRLALETIAAWAVGLSPENANGLIQNILRAIEERPYRFLSKEFVGAVAPELEEIPPQHLELSALCGEVAAELNQEFLRARYGGMYHTERTSKEMVFRISSIGFNWYSLICQFIASAPQPINSVTIIRDEESTGTMDGYYKTKNGNARYRQLPIVYLLEEQGRPIAENQYLTIQTGHYTDMTNRILTELSAGVPHRQLLKLPMNAGRIREKLEVLSFKEKLLVG